LTRSPFPVRRVYGVDLAGAAAGCLGALMLLNPTDGPSAVLWVSNNALGAALLDQGSAESPRHGYLLPCRSSTSR
jgi:hypothetical protein